MHFLNSKERKRFFGELAELYGYDGTTDMAVFVGGREKHYVVSRDLDRIDLGNVSMRHAGLYIASPMGPGMRLTLDGAQLLGPHCTNKTEISSKQRDAWMRGEDVEVGELDVLLTIVTCEGDIIGCAPVKDGVLLNYLPNSRRVTDPH